MAEPGCPACHSSWLCPIPICHCTYSPSLSPLVLALTFWVTLSPKGVEMGAGSKVKSLLCVVAFGMGDSQIKLSFMSSSFNAEVCGTQFHHSKIDQKIWCVFKLQKMYYSERHVAMNPLNVLFLALNTLPSFLPFSIAVQKSCPIFICAIQAASRIDLRCFHVIVILILGKSQKVHGARSGG